MIERKSIQTIKVDLNDMTADRRVRLSPRSIGRLPGGVIRCGDVVELADDEDGDCLLVALATVEKDVMDCDQWVARPLEWPPRREYVNQRDCEREPIEEQLTVPCVTCGHPRAMHKGKGTCCHSWRNDGEPCQCKCFVTIRPDQPDPLQPDMVNHPPHYADLDPEPINVIESWQLGFHEGNALKYLARAGRKDPTRTIEDLEKARFYLDRLIKNKKATKGS